jgi:hypothetical protein
MGDVLQAALVFVGERLLLAVPVFARVNPGAKPSRASRPISL